MRLTTFFSDLLSITKNDLLWYHQSHDTTVLSKSRILTLFFIDAAWSACTHEQRRAGRYSAFWQYLCIAGALLTPMMDKIGLEPICLPRPRRNRTARAITSLCHYSLLIHIWMITSYTYYHHTSVFNASQRPICGFFIPHSVSGVTGVSHLIELSTILANMITAFILLRWWEEMESNHPSQRQQIYSLPRYHLRYIFPYVKG